MHLQSSILYKVELDFGSWTALPSEAIQGHEVKYWESFLWVTCDRHILTVQSKYGSDKTYLEC